MDYETIIRDEMDDQGVFPDEIHSRTAKQGVKGSGIFKCSSCSRKWTTHRGHAVINLKEQRVVRIWKQKCKACDGEEEPIFRELDFHKMVVKAIEQERFFRNNPARGDVFDNGDDGNGHRGKPHESRLCEKCGYGRWQCWKRGYRSSDTDGDSD